MKKKVNGGIMLYFLGLQNHCGWWLHHGIKGCLLLGRKAMTNLDSILKSRDITLLTKFPYGQNYGFSSSHVQMWEFDYKKGWMPKNWYFWTVVLEKTLESPLDCKIKPVNPKGSRLRIFIGRTDAEAEAPILWLSDTKSWLCKNPDAGKDWGQEKERATEDKMVGWHHPTQWTWVQANFRKWWSTGKPGVLQSIGLKRDGI